MYISPLTSDRRGFSILVALGTTGVLLILVIGLASLYVNEMKLSRLQYDSTLTSAQAEGAFEYAMLKVKNHREGFADSVTPDDLDGTIFSGSTERTKNIQTQYTITAQSGTYTTQLDEGRSLILPLSVGTGIFLRSSNPSINPITNTGTDQVRSITSLSTGNNANISWSIIAMSGAGIGAESVGITGTGDIDASKIANMRLHAVDCYNNSGDKDATSNTGSCLNSLFQAEAIDYFYDLTGSVNEFLTAKTSGKFESIDISDPYIMIFNGGTTSQSVTLTTASPFSLPLLTIRAESQKGDAAQVIEFTENKARYSEALNFGVYNTVP